MIGVCQQRPEREVKEGQGPLVMMTKVVMMAKVVNMANVVMVTLLLKLAD